MGDETAGVRAVQAPDREAIIDIARASGLFSNDELDEVSATLDAFLDRSAADDRWVVAQDDRGHPVGVAYAAPERMTEGTWNLLMLIVHPDHERRGHGGVLVRHVEDELRRAGGRVVLIETSGTPAFSGQRRFYAGHGYVEEGRIRDYYQPGDDKIVFWKQLETAA